MKPLKVFVMQPFSMDHSDKLYTWIKSTCNRSKGKFEALRADDPTHVPAPLLQDRVDHYIKDADICVADLTGERNQNVLLEVGAAYALQIPVIPISDKPLPTDIIGNLYVPLSPKSMGDEFEEDFSRELFKRLNEASQKLTSDRSSQFMAYGYETRNHIDFYALVRRAENRIWLLTTNLGFFVRQDLNREKDSRAKTLLQMIASELPTKPSAFNIRLLVMDPDSNFTNDRARALERNLRDFRESLRRDLEIVFRFIQSEDCTRSVQIATYDAFPLQMTFFFDNQVVSSVVADGRSSRDCVTYSHSLDVRGAKETYERHFDKLWSKGRIIASSNTGVEQEVTWKLEPIL